MSLAHTASALYAQADARQEELIREALSIDDTTTSDDDHSKNADDATGNDSELEKYRLLVKWKRLILLRNLDLVPMQSLIASGVPDVLRGVAWKWFCKADDHLSETRTFKQLVELSYKADQDTRLAIEKDIRRTFPRHVLFETAQGQEQLSQVLCAYAVSDPHVGYCQGMGFIAALLLCYTCAEDAFWILRSIMCRPEFDLRAMLSPGMPRFAPAMRELSRFIEIILPDVAAKLSRFSIDPSIFASQWFITLFAYNLPFQLVARIWDLFLLKRWSVIFRVSLVLLSLARKEFAEAEDPETILRLLKSISARIQVEDVNQIIERAMRLNLDEDDARVLGNVGDPNEDFLIAD